MEIVKALGGLMSGDGRRILRIVAADDSAVMRRVMKTIFDLHTADEGSALPRMELSGVARDGEEALDAVRRLQPDVLLLDWEMPRLNGLGVLERLKVVAPDLPVILCSAHTARGARVTLEALALGAKDYVMKPGQQKDFAAALDHLMEELLPKIAALAGEGHAGGRGPESSASGLRGVPARAPGGARIDVVVIGVSTGGPSALERMLPRLPRDFAAPVMIVQHMPKLFTVALAERLDRVCGLAVKEARSGVKVRAGEVWLAPGDAHMEVGPGGVVRLHQGPALNSCTPSADYLFRSAAAHYGSAALALVMTGMGSDGLDGAGAVRDAGGTVLAQDEASSAVWGMPGRVAKSGLADAVVPLDGLAGALLERVQGARGMAAMSVIGEREVMHGML